MTKVKGDYGDFASVHFTSWIFNNFFSDHAFPKKIKNQFTVVYWKKKNTQLKSWELFYLAAKTEALSLEDSLSDHSEGLLWRG